MTDQNENEQTTMQHAVTEQTTVEQTPGQETSTLDVAEQVGADSRAQQHPATETPKRRSDGPDVFIK